MSARPGRQAGFFKKLDLTFAIVILLALLGLGVFFRVMSTTVLQPLSYKAEMQIDPDRYTKYQVKPSPPVDKVEQPRAKELSGLEEDEKAKGEEGKLDRK